MILNNLTYNKIYIYPKSYVFIIPQKSINFTFSIKPSPKMDDTITPPPLFSPMDLSSTTSK